MTKKTEKSNWRNIATLLQHVGLDLEQWDLFPGSTCTYTEFHAICTKYHVAIFSIVHANF